MALGSENIRCGKGRKNTPVWKQGKGGMGSAQISVEKSPGKGLFPGWSEKMPGHAAPESTSWVVGAQPIRPQNGLPQPLAAPPRAQRFAAPPPT